MCAMPRPKGMFSNIFKKIFGESQPSEIEDFSLKRRENTRVKEEDSLPKKKSKEPKISGRGYVGAKTGFIPEVKRKYAKSAKLKRVNHGKEKSS